MISSAKCGTRMDPSRTGLVSRNLWIHGDDFRPSDPDPAQL